MATWASLPVTGIATLLECGSSAAARPVGALQPQGAQAEQLLAASEAPILLRLLRDDVAVSRAVREAALQVMNTAMLTATDELVPVGPAVLCRAVRAVPCRAVPCCAVPCRAVLCRAVPCRAVL